MGGRLPAHQRVPRHVKVDPETARDPRRVAHFLRQASLPVADWAGCTIFVFPELERDDEPIFLDERVRHFYRQLCHDAPFLLYFLDPEPAYGAILSVICAFARDDQVIERGGRYVVDPDGPLRSRFGQLVADAAAYATRRGDDWQAFVDELGLPDDLNEEALRLCKLRL